MMPHGEGCLGCSVQQMHSEGYWLIRPFIAAAALYHDDLWDS